MLKVFTIVCVVATVGISIKYFYLLYVIKQKKRKLKIITPSERIQYRNWSIVFFTTIAALVIGLGSALVTYI